MTDEKYHKPLTTFIGLLKEGEGRAPKGPDGKPGRLVAIGVINKNEGDRQCDPPWDVEPEDEPADHATRVIEKCQEVVNSRRRLQTMAATFYFVSNDKKRTPLAGSPMQKHAISYEMTFDPENRGTGAMDSDWSAPHDLKRKDAQEASVLALAFDVISKANDTLQMQTQSIATFAANIMEDHRQDRAAMRTEITAVHTSLNDERKAHLTALDASLDRELKRTLTLADIRAKEGMTEIRQGLMKALTPAVTDIASLGSHALAQYAGKAMGVAPTSAQKSIMDSFKPIIGNPVKLAQVFAGLGLSDEETQQVLNGIALMRQAEKMSEPTDDQKRAMTGVRGPALTVAKFKMIPGVAEVFASANQTQASVAGAGAGK